MALLGFRHLAPSTPKGRKGGGGGKSGGSSKNKTTDAQAVSVYTSMLGKDPTVNQIEAVQGQLAQNPSVEAQIANIKLGTQKQDLLIKQRKSAHSTQSYNDSISDDKKEAMVDSKGNIISLTTLASRYNDIYSGAAIDYQRKVVDKAIESGTDTQEMRDYQKALQDKANFYQNIAIAANTRGPDGKVGNYTNLGIVAVPSINPSDNSVQGIDFMTSQEATKNKNLMLTDTGIQSTDEGGRIPMALPVNYYPDPTNPNKLVAQATFGNVVYSGQRVPLTDSNGDPILDANGDQKYSTTDQLKVQNANDPNIKDVLTNGVSLKASLGVKADTSGKPALGTVTTRGGKVFYTDENGKTQYAPGDTLEDSTNNMKTYLSFLGKDPNKLMPSALLTAPSGTDPNMIDMSVTTTPRASTSQPQQFSSPYAGLGSVAGPLVAAATGFFSKKAAEPAQQAPQTAPAPTPTTPEAANKPNAPKESVGGKSWVTDIVAKGAKFFGGQA